ncbi:type II toxin-antitoxin system HipA family toxin YjjJ [Rhodoferax mekongensis]|uniref:type II toxin-antitoxin system HipA family toxin YjjJ n=3 Tax=Burkholderiales TaxID=80840 RepID=UPI0028BDEDF9|nr:type II toxin-antitoxin system HipA family toxin YjjJ [Rhodoferax sp. TBRC 17199]MDT7513626.1 type II toxin-antitoxin system HipA family toxin YjjJ [Rhodoferax sp. TBRC 17199]
MPATPDLSASILQALRRQGGALSSAELQTALGVSQPTVSRALAPLIQAGEVQKVGAARKQRYVLPRTVRDVGRSVPIMRINAHGQPSPFGRMVPLASGAVWVDEEDGLSKRFDGLPWFLDDMRPQGFMGRTFASAHPELQLGNDPRYWSDDDVLRALALCGDDLPGNLVVGEAAFARFHTLPQRARRAASPADYPSLADAAMQGSMGGSSAGGEQPKFCAITGDRHVLVKFSPAGDAPTDQRTRDLLVCEHLALHTLASAGIAAATSRIHTGASRVFLEVERFDRMPISAANPQGLGRIGMVSLMVYDAEYVGAMDNWGATANRMQERGLLRPADARTLRLLEAFGELIANTDRHYGNISLLLDDDDWALAPAYDMLPMLYAPVGGELVPRNFADRPLQPTAATLPEWPQALALARSFWAAASADARISPGFRQVAAENLSHISR